MLQHILIYCELDEDLFIVFNKPNIITEHFDNFMMQEEQQ